MKHEIIKGKPDVIARLDALIFKTLGSLLFAGILGAVIVVANAILRGAPP
jgi:hypothetical protein